MQISFKHAHIMYISIHNLRNPSALCKHVDKGFIPDFFTLLKLRTTYRMSGSCRDLQSVVTHCGPLCS